MTILCKNYSFRKKQIHEVEKYFATSEYYLYHNEHVRGTMIDVITAYE